MGLANFSLFRLKPLRGSMRTGFTLIETVVATGILLSFVAAIFVTSLQCIQILRMARGQAAASQILQQRNEQMRIANWTEMTDPSWLVTNILGRDANGTNILSNVQETIWIAPFSTGSNTIVTAGTNSFSRSNGVGTSNNTLNLSGNTAVQVTWQVSWTENPTGRALTRTITTIIANGGTPK